MSNVTIPILKDVNYKNSLDKVSTQDPPYGSEQKYFTASDANEIKNAINQNNRDLNDFMHGIVDEVHNISVNGVEAGVLDGIENELARLQELIEGGRPAYTRCFR